MPGLSFKFRRDGEVDGSHLSAADPASRACPSPVAAERLSPTLLRTCIFGYKSLLSARPQLSRCSAKLAYL